MLYAKVHMAIDPTRPVSDILDREDEQRLISELIAKRRNILLYGPRRLGKSSLLKSVAGSHEADHIVIFVDCTRHETEEETARLILRRLGAGAGGRLRRFWDWIKDHLRATQVIVVTDATGPRLEIDPSGRAGKSLADALELVGRVADGQDVSALVILDEFQVIMGRPDAPIAEMRSVAQAHPNLVLILSGSVETVLKRLVQDSKAPFWKQLVEVPIRGLSVDDVQSDLPRHGIVLDEPARRSLLEACGHNTLRLMEVLQFLECRGHIGDAAARDAIDRVSRLHSADFERDLSRVKPGIQRRLLFGLARDRPDHPTGTTFIQAHDLRTQGSVQRALQRLKTLEILDEDNGFLDPLFGHWLRGDSL